ncbi:MAG: hypothetical protein OIF54_15910, partial [Cohaesibacter sp.]|nr:hypothetical protein [Cohaesibacter sp.]
MGAENVPRPAEQFVGKGNFGQELKRNHGKITPRLLAFISFVSFYFGLLGFICFILAFFHFGFWAFISFIFAFAAIFHSASKNTTRPESGQDARISLHFFLSKDFIKLAGKLQF